MTFWLIKHLEPSFYDAWEEAGEVDLSALPQTPRHPPKHFDLPRYHYLLKTDARVRLTCVGMPLKDWLKRQVGIIVGTTKSLGEFEATKDLRGEQTLVLKMEPGALSPPYDEVFESGAEALESISWQILDKHKIDAVQNPPPRRHGRWTI